NRPRFPGLEIARGEHVHGFAPFRSGNVNGVAIHKGAAEFVAVSKGWKRLAGFMVDQPKVIGFSLVIPVTIPNPFKPIKAIAEDDGRRFNQIEVEGALFANQRFLTGVEWSSTVCRQPIVRLDGGRMFPNKIHDGSRIIQPMWMMLSACLGN